MDNIYNCSNSHYLLATCNIYSCSNLSARREKFKLSHHHKKELRYFKFLIGRSHVKGKFVRVVDTNNYTQQLNPLTQ